MHHAWTTHESLTNAYYFKILEHGMDDKLSDQTTQ